MMAIGDQKHHQHQIVQQATNKRGLLTGGGVHFINNSKTGLHIHDLTGNIHCLHSYIAYKAYKPANKQFPQH